MKYDMNAMMNMVDILSAEARKECTAKAQGYAALSESADEINEKCAKSPIIVDIMKRHVNPLFKETPTAEDINKAIESGYIVNSIINGYLGHCFADQAIDNAYIPFSSLISEGYIAENNTKYFAAIAENEKDEIAKSYFKSLSNDIATLLKQFTIDFTSEGMLPSDFEGYVNGSISDIRFREYATATEDQTEEQHHAFIRNQAYDEFVNLSIIITAVNTAANTVFTTANENTEEAAAPAEENNADAGIPVEESTAASTEVEAPVNVDMSSGEVAHDGGVPAGEGGEPAPNNAIEILE